MSFNFLFFYRKYFLSKFFFFESNKKFDVKYNNLPIINEPLKKSISTQTSFDDLSILLNSSDDYDNEEIPRESFINIGDELFKLSQ